MSGNGVIKPNRLVGHTLPHEGRLPGNGWSDRNGEGATRCSCGEPSPWLPSTNARKQWHREHKDAVRSSTPGCSPGRGESGEGVRGSAASLDAPLTESQKEQK